MNAAVGDQLIVHGRTVGEPDQVFEIVEILGEDGTPPFRVRTDSGDEAIVAPGPDTQLVRRG
ncbi:MAG: DUF1918 domain-containing protein [Nocardia sp.]|nr:DUF1918 domain-containing protein [Nocardia sp.]